MLSDNGPRPARSLPAVGWREWVTLPELGVGPIKTKVDTGARTSALHAFELDVVEGSEGPLARFVIHPHQRRSSSAVRVESPIVAWRAVRSSNGAVEERPSIHTMVTLGAHCFGVEMTLTNRDEMGFRLLLGRAAVRHRFLVDPSRSYIQSSRAATRPMVAQRTR